MLVKTGLLIVSNPKQIGTVLSSVRKYVQSTLYIHLLSVLSDPFGGFHHPCPKSSQTICGIYSQAAKHCGDLDVRVLLSGLKFKNLTQIQTQRTIELVVFDQSYAQNEIDSFMQNRVANISAGCTFNIIDTGRFQPETDREEQQKMYRHAVLGGTFDRLHVAHKHLLSEAVLRSTNTVSIGVTEEHMLKKKLLWELIEPIDRRISAVEDFLRDVCPEQNASVIKIADEFGPTQSDPTMDLLIVSSETMAGGHKCNEVRERNGLKKLNLLCVELIDEPFPQENEEPKISSSTTRLRLLGTLLKPPIKNNHVIGDTHYVIGLTGGIASGKSSVASGLSELGADIINCDKIAHECYAQGTQLYTNLISEFGERILDTNGDINRKVLGTIVFKDQEQLRKLNSLVWPAIMDVVTKKIKTSKAKVVIVEAAVLFQAGWEKCCHEVWVTFVPPEEAVKRLKERNNLSEREALARISTQTPNKENVSRANVVFCTLWSSEFTKAQISKAWTLLQNRLRV